MDKSNIQRIKNVINGNYTEGTKIVSGYKKKNISDRIEGEIWEDDGKVWTIKNGIRQNITKLDEIRKLNLMPILCPICNRPMTKNLDKKFWQLKGKCLDCQVEEDNARIEAGTFISYTKDVMRANVESYVQELKEQLKSYIESIGAQHFITENGDIEEWVGGKSKEEYKAIFDEKLKKLDAMIMEKFDEVNSEKTGD